MTGDCHVRFCEGWRGKFPPSTRHTHIRVLVNALRLFEVMLSLILVSEANVKYIVL